MHNTRSCAHFLEKCGQRKMDKVLNPPIATSSSLCIFPSQFLFLSLHLVFLCSKGTNWIFVPLTIEQGLPLLAYEPRSRSLYWRWRKVWEHVVDTESLCSRHFAIVCSHNCWWQNLCTESVDYMPMKYSMCFKTLYAFLLTTSQPELSRPSVLCEPQCPRLLTHPIPSKQQPKACQEN